MRDDAPIVVRRAGPRDAHAILALGGEVQALHVAARPDLFRAGGSETPAEIVARIERPDEAYWVASLGGEVAGFAWAQWQGEPASPLKHATRTLTLHAIGVGAAYRGRGIGERLWEAVREEAARQRVARVILNVWAFNTGARAFYERLGFTPFHTRMAVEMGGGALDSAGARRDHADAADTPPEPA